MLISAQIKPNSRKGPLVETQECGSLVLFVREPAIDGQANEGAIKLLAKHFGVAPSRVRLQRGATSKFKRFDVDV